MSAKSVNPNGLSVLSTFEEWSVAMKRVLATGTMFFSALFVAFMIVSPASAGEKWGAIAGDDTVGERDPAYGVGGGDSEKDAKKNALKYCKEAKGANCKVVVTYNECGAYAVTKKYSGVGSAKSKAAAEKIAVEKCGSPKCKVVVSDCNQ
ncbi:MAG: DUF4189 domain-containing protein [Magnetococcales bacterium]|nr:DUF4189 domain-containing protein [Magnetococcales bacterium]